MTLGGGSSVGAAAAAAASTTEGARVVQQSLTPECALAMLFPPEPLRVTTPRHAEKDAALSGTVTLRGPDTGWMKVAAIDHTGRLDSVHLQEHLERRCREEHARPSGIVCPVREGIYTDGLREAIRQTTVLCPERGLLLAELSAEMQQTTNTYDILFDSACQYAVRKAIERDLRSDLFVEKEQLESEVRRLENRVNELRAKHDGMVKRFEEQMQTEVNMHEEEVKYLKKANQQIVNEIKRLIALEKAGATAQASGQKPA
ncbi:putative dynein arm light chain, axonemal [Trypanosoma grayi]|uniref:putative dynein arm light chain, axonemal n=1 Tax=Trypanosoma grayi TaxID=71804 RepID=UPI0004F43F19|nr:putative dynein arm light chain, axonemal [Trypanosoma grayi]KEG06165.1 putative dynein arm light chain, axonemal [Trypanosoma grayi]